MFRRLLVRDHREPVAPGLAAGRVIAVIVRQHHMRNRLVETLVELGLQPLYGFGVDWIGDDDSVRRLDEHRVVETVLEPVDVALDVFDGALAGLGQRAFRYPGTDNAQGKRHEPEEEQDKRTLTHDITHRTLHQPALSSADFGTLEQPNVARW